jgi:hypothetical protein
MSEEKKITEREASIRLRMIAGLSREQAEQVEANQEAHDAALAKAAKVPAAPAEGEGKAPAEKKK